MIRALRRGHLIVGTAVLAVAPVVVAASIASRPSDHFGAALPAEPQVTLEPIAGMPIELGRTFDPGGIAVRLTARALDLADPLLYWVPMGSTGDSVPAAAILVGALAPRVTATRIPAGVEASGVLLLVDGGHRRVVALAPAPAWIGGAGSR